MFDPSKLSDQQLDRLIEVKNQFDKDPKSINPESLQDHEVDYLHEHHQVPKAI